LTKKRANPFFSKNAGRLFRAAFGCFILAAFLAAVPATKFGHKHYSEAPAADLIVVGSYRGSRDVKMRRAAAQAFKSLTAAAKQDGIDIIPISGFRPVSYQKGLFDRAKKRYGSEKKAARWVAPPGYSEHATGFTLDLGDAAAPAADVDTDFEKTKAYAWLGRRAAEFGFELSFPKGNAQGVSFEPWHWRYVGDADARRVFGKN
jgi:D-alanyl-D-alanine carboxypeptidase